MVATLSLYYEKRNQHTFFKSVFTLVESSCAMVKRNEHYDASMTRVQEETTTTTTKMENADANLVSVQSSEVGGTDRRKKEKSSLCCSNK